MQVKIGLVQKSCQESKENNILEAINQIREIAKMGANIICLQEIFSTLYFCDVQDHDNFKLAEPIPGDTTERLQALSKELGVVIIASMFEKRTKGLYFNTTAVIDADGEIGRASCRERV